MLVSFFYFISEQNFNYFSFFLLTNINLFFTIFHFFNVNYNNLFLYYRLFFSFIINIIKI